MSETFAKGTDFYKKLHGTKGTLNWSDTSKTLSFTNEKNETIELYVVDSEEVEEEDTFEPDED